MNSVDHRAPTPRAAVADPALARPDWTVGEPRNRARLWLDKNENADPEYAEVVARIVADIPREALYTYPESAPLYHKLARHLGVPVDCLLLAAGSDGAIRAAFDAFVAPGDTVVHAAPTFAMYPVYCRMYGAHAMPLAYRASEAGPVLDVETVIRTIREARPRMVCLANPDSPTGTVFRSEALRAIVEAAGAASALMLIDEAYYPFYEASVLSWISDYPHLMVTRSTGKAWGIAGFRIGYAAAAPGVATLLHKVRSMYETSTMSMAVFERLLDHVDDMRASVARLNDGKLSFVGAMEALRFRALAGHGNFCHVAFGAKAEAVHAALTEFVYYRRHSGEPCLAGFSRFTATTRARFQPVIERIRAAAEA